MLVCKMGLDPIRIPRGELWGPGRGPNWVSTNLWMGVVLTFQIQQVAAPVWSPETGDPERLSCPDSLGRNPAPQGLPWAGGAAGAQAYLVHSPAQDNAALLGEGLLGAQQVVDEQGNGGKAIALQSVQVLRGKGSWGQQPSLLRGPEPWGEGAGSSREKGSAQDGRQRHCRKA